MSLLKNIVRQAVGDGISKGIRDAVEKATETIVAPRAEAYANKVANSLDTAAKSVEDSAAALNAQTETVRKSSSLEDSLNRMTQAANRYASAMENLAATQADLAEQWAKYAPGFPLWQFGGSSFWFSTAGTTCDGYPIVLFELDDATQEGLDMYVAVLKQNGFVQKYRGYDDELYRDLGGRYLIFSKTEAFNAAPHMTIALYRSKDRSEITP